MGYYPTGYSCNVITMATIRGCRSQMSTETCSWTHDRKCSQMTHIGWLKPARPVGIECPNSPASCHLDYTMILSKRAPVAQTDRALASGARCGSSSLPGGTITSDASPYARMTYLFLFPFGYPRCLLHYWLCHGLYGLTRKTHDSILRTLPRKL